MSQSLNSLRGVMGVYRYTGFRVWGLNSSKVNKDYIAEYYRGS